MTSRLRLDLTDASVYNNRGNTYSNKGDFDQAFSEYNKAIELDPQLDQAYVNRGFLLL